MDWWQVGVVKTRGREKKRGREPRGREEEFGIRRGTGCCYVVARF
jgi:hypothetical protein